MSDSSGSPNGIKAFTACFFGSSVGAGAVLLYIHSVMMGPITHEFSWNRGTFGLAILLSTLVNAAVVPFVGRAADRWGARSVILPGIVLFALAMAAMSLATPMTYIPLFMVLGAVASVQGPQIYSKIISAWYLGRRGLVLGLIAVGAAVGGAIWPQYVRIVNSHYGWRGGYVALGIAIFAVGFPVCLALLAEPRQDAPTLQERALATIEHLGMSLREIVLSGPFWMITAALTLSVTSIGAVLVHTVPLLTDRGLALPLAVGVVSSIALAQIAGRLVSGYLLDVYSAPRVALFFFACPLFGVLLLHYGSGLGLISAGLFVGFSFGAEVEIGAYFFSLYFGLRTFAAAYALSYAAFGVGAGLGPFIVGHMFDISGNYGSALLTVDMMFAAALALMVFLGPYVYQVDGEKIGTLPRTAGA